MPTSIGTLAGFQRVLAAQDQPLRVFDWDKAARILKERQPALAVAGLDGDWGNTAVLIWEDGGPTEVDYSCLGSKWAIPTLLIEQVLLEDGGATEEIECWRYQGEDCAWDERVWWPESARAIVAGDGG